MSWTKEDPAAFAVGPHCFHRCLLSAPQEGLELLVEIVQIYLGAGHRAGLGEPVPPSLRLARGFLARRPRLGLRLLPPHRHTLRAAFLADVEVTDGRLSCSDCEESSSAVADICSLAEAFCGIVR